jgi:hypothetical protein
LGFTPASKRPSATDRCEIAALSATDGLPRGLQIVHGAGIRAQATQRRDDALAYSWIVIKNKNVAPEEFAGCHD